MTDESARHEYEVEADPYEEYDEGGVARADVPAADPEGGVYVADSGNHRVQIFTPKGAHRNTVPLPPPPSGPAPDPTDVTVDFGRSRFFVADNDNHRILVYDMAASRFTDTWGSFGQGPLHFRFPFLLDCTPQGYLLVVEPINTRVQVINPRGKFVGFLGAWGVRPGQLFRPKGVAVCGDRIFVSDSYLGKIEVFDLRGRFHGVLVGRDGKPLPFVTPTGLAADPARKRLYIVELQANRVACVQVE